MIYKFRAIFDSKDEEDVFRDIAIKSTDTLEDLHNTLLNAFGFDGSEGGSFYTCDDQWNQEEEIPLFDMGDVPGEQKTMADFQIEDLLYEEKTKIIYIYDPFNMWTFLVELAAIEEENQYADTDLPTLLFAKGVLPADAPISDFGYIDVKEDNFDDFEDDYDDDDFDMFEGDDFNNGYYDDEY